MITGAKVKCGYGYDYGHQSTARAYIAVWRLAGNTVPIY
jgi:hypothetical protein